MTFTTEQLMDAVKNDFLKLKKENKELKEALDKSQDGNDELIESCKKLVKKDDELLKTNKSLKAYIDNLEEQLLQMRLQNSFYESMFQDVEQNPKPRRIELFKEQERIRNETMDATQEKKPNPSHMRDMSDSLEHYPRPKPHPLEKKMKKSLGQVKSHTTREPIYHMTEVARDWAS
jgi:chromosome segregation ATPase